LAWGKQHAALVLLQAGASVDRPLGVGGETPLMTAARRGPLVVVEALLSHGADPTCRDEEGRTALHYAALGNEAEIAGVLLKVGLSAEDKDNAGESAWGTALREQARETAELLLEHLGDAGAALPAACRWGAVEDVSRLLARGARPDGECLVLAAGRWEEADFDDAYISVRGAAERRAETREMTRVLLEAGAPAGVDALSAACQARNKGVAELLLSAGVNPSAADRSGDYPLLKAAEHGDLALVKALLDAGADRSVRDSLGRDGAQRIKDRAALLEGLLERYGRSRALQPQESGTRAALDRIQRDGPLIVRWLEVAGQS
jgi:hypothetical protein